MIHPETYLKQTDKGFGVFTKRKFQRGEILWIIDDQDIKVPYNDYLNYSTQHLNKLNIYSYLDSENQVIIPWDEGKYVNHSCSPNSVGLLQFDNISIAMREIVENEEIVEDYDCYYGHFETFSCLCNSPNCRKIINHPEKDKSASRLNLVEIADQILSYEQELLQYETSEVLKFKKILQTYSKTVAA